MKEPKIDKNKIKKCLKRLKIGKRAGPHGLKPDYYKAMLKSEVCLEALVNCYKK